MIDSYIKEFSEIVRNSIIDSNGEISKDNSAMFQQAADLIDSCANNRGKVFLVGNGGSSGIISHSSIDFINACKIPAVPLTDNSILTCLANDYGYENVFSEALETMFTDSDILIAVSSSGNSQNIRNAAITARNKGGKVFTYSGFSSDNLLRKLGDINFWLNSSDYGKVEIGHALLLHILTDELSRRRKVS